MNPNRPAWTPADDAYVIEHYPTVPAATIAAHFGRTKNGVIKRARALGAKAVFRAPEVMKPARTRMTPEEALARRKERDAARHLRRKATSGPKPKERNPAILKPCIPARPMSGRGPASLVDKVADESRAVRTVAPTPPAKFAVPKDFKGPFSLVGIGRDAMTGQAWSA